MRTTVTDVSESVTQKIAAARARLTPAERKVAEVIAGDPGGAAFLTVAELATRSGTSGPTVVRLAGKLGYQGFSEWQTDIQAEVTRQLRPATERIRQPGRGDVLGAAAAAEVENVRRTLERVEPAAFTAAVNLLADRRRRICVLSGEATRPGGAVLASGLDALRPDVVLIEGSEVAVARQLAPTSGRGTDVVVAIDLRRYERWVLRAAAAAAADGAVVVAVTDSLLSPLAALGGPAFVVAADSPGPFDSLVGVVALANAFVTAVAARSRAAATRRVDAVEAAWSAAGVLADDDRPG